MPVGFENSALKMSFSLSSLQPGGGQGTPQQAMAQAERPYHSLNKKSRRDVVQEAWRRSWGAQEDKKDDFWAALQSNYTYLMDNNLIESCKEAHVELSCDEEETALLSKWSFKDFTAQFSELCSWLNMIFEAVFGTEDNSRDPNIRLEHLEAMQRNMYKRKLFTEQAKRLLLEHSELQDEVTWRVDFLNKKWDMLEQTMSPSKGQLQKDFCDDLEHEADFLKEWIRDMERRLKPLNMQVAKDWSNQELIEKITENKVLLQDIQAHNKVVDAVLKRAKAENSDSKLQLAKHLKKRWLKMFLLGLEWQMYLQDILKNRKHVSGNVNVESDEEPLSKQPRLSSADGSDHLTDDGSYFEDDLEDLCMKDLNTSMATDKMCSSSCDAANFSPEKLHKRMVLKRTGDGKGADVERGDRVDETCASDNTLGTQTTGTSPMDKSNIFSQSDRKALNCATFYFKHPEADCDQLEVKRCTEGDIASLNSRVRECEESSDDDDEWTFTSGKKNQMPSDRGSVDTLGNAELKSKSTSKRNVAVRLDFGENGESSLEGAGRQSFEEMLKKSGAESSCSEMLSMPRSTENTKECIKWLVHQAEQLVREDVLRCDMPEDPASLGLDASNGAANMRQERIRQWLHSALQSKFQVVDSCDASGETTGGSDEESSMELREESTGISLVNKHLDALYRANPRLDSSGNFSDPNTTLKAESSPYSAAAREPGKVVKRSKQQSRRERPWSVSGISQLSSFTRTDEESGFVNFSTSESALHQIVGPSNTKQEKKGELSKGILDHLSSSTVYENSTKIPSEHGSLPRRRRHRKKTLQNLCGKSDSTFGTPNQAASCNMASSPKFRNSFKSVPKAQGTPAEERSRTLSDTSCTSGTSEENTVSDSSIFPTESSCSRVAVDDRTLGSDEELFSRKSLGFLSFRLGPKEGAVTPKADILSGALLQCKQDSDGDKASGLLAADEQLSSSEQAWDNYQEKYMSETYSEEPPDPEVTKSLLDFGDDYHKYLDSQSDCASSIELSQRTSPLRKRKSIVGVGDNSVLDSDSDLEDIHQVVQQSQSDLVLTEQLLSKHLSKTSPEIITDYADIIATCKEHKRCLKVILESEKEREILMPKERREIQDLLEKWNELQIYADELQKMSPLQQKLIMLRKKLLETTSKISSLADNLNDLSHLELAIEMLKEESSSLLDFKEQLSRLNVDVHQLSTEAASQSNSVANLMPQLKDDITDLYRIWTFSSQSVSARLEQFQSAVATWQKLDKEVADLQMTLEGDHSMLLGLGKSLDDGAAAVEDVAVSIRDIARVLSEVPGSSHRVHSSALSSCQELQDGSLGAREGSLSDSGISDSGSENEQSERARRLAFLRELALHLQAELGTSDGLVNQINEQIERLDRELHQLQDSCRKLIVRTSVWAGIPAPEASVSAIESKVADEAQTESSSHHKEANDKNVNVRSKRHPSRSTGPRYRRQTSSTEKGSRWEKHLPWIRRIARAAVPVQLTLVTLVFLACFLTPHCCESINNLGLTMSPQLRYLNGPPPV